MSLRQMTKIHIEKRKKHNEEAGKVGTVINAGNVDGSEVDV